jgi:hypothetical protein
MRRRSYRSIKRKSRKKSDRRISKKRSQKRSFIRPMKHMIQTLPYVEYENSSDELYKAISNKVTRKRNMLETIDDEKYFTFEYPLLRESLLTKELGVLGEIIKRVKVIEGPISLAGLNPTKKLKKIVPTAPQILLLGDYHIGSDKCRRYLYPLNIQCSLSEDCYTLYESSKDNSFVQLLDKLGEYYKIGYFIESWENEVEERSHKDLDENMRYMINLSVSAGGGHNSALVWSSRDLENCYYQRKNKRNENCLLKNIEVHMADPRKVYDKEFEKDYKYQADMIIDMFKKSLESGNSLMIMKRIQQKYFPKVSYKTMIKNIKTILVENLGYDEVFWNSELFDEYSRTKRQLKNLPKEIQNIFRNYKILKYETIEEGGGFMRDDKLEFNQLMKQIFNDLLDEKNPDSTLIDSVVNNIMYNKIFDITSTIPDILDLYYIGRTLRPSYGFDLSVGFFGNSHNIRMIDFLIKEGLYEKVIYYGQNPKFKVDEEYAHLRENKFYEYKKIQDKYAMIGKMFEKCIPLT